MDEKHSVLLINYKLNWDKMHNAHDLMFQGAFFQELIVSKKKIF